MTDSIAFRGFRHFRRALPPPNPYVPSGANAPTISALNYSLGDVAGAGNSIVITGTNLDTVTSVSFGGTSASITAQDATTVTVTLPSHAAGVVDVSVTNPDGSATSVNAFEFWAPTTDAACTLLFDCVSSAYDAVTGTWVARYSAVANSNLTNGSATYHSATDGAPTFDGDSATEAGLLQAAGPTWANYWGANVAGEFAGSVAAVYSSTSTNALDLVTSPYGNPQAVGNENSSSGTFGLGFGNDAGTPSVYAHTYIAGGAAYKAIAVPATAGNLHAVVTRWGTGAGSFDLSLNGDLVGAGFATVATAAGSDITYSAYPISCGLSYPDSVATSQSFAGVLRAFAVLNAKASDTFVTKFYSWSRQRHNVA